MNQARRTTILAWLLLLPALAFLIAFTIYPALDSVYLSLFKFNAFMTERSFVGLSNYSLLTTSPEYWQSLGVTFEFLLLTVIPTVALSLVLALLLDAGPFGAGFFRTLFLLPVSISSAMAAMLWIFIFNPTSGFLNAALESLGTHGPNWLGDPRWSMLAVSIITIWKETGFNVIFLLAGLASISPDLKEAARLDGASRAQVLWSVTLPLLSPTLFFVCVVSVIASFQSFGQIHILTQGGPAGSTRTLVYNLYRDAFQNFQTGSASAQAVILFALILAVTYVQFKAAQSKVHYR